MQILFRKTPEINEISDYKLSNGINKPTLLERALRGNLPIEVRDKVQRILNS